MLKLVFNSPQTREGNGYLGRPFPLQSSGFQNSVKTMMKSNWRKPWEYLPKEYPQNFNYHVTINPDPKCTWITDCRDRKSHHRKLREFLELAFYKKLFSDVVVIYEYGKYGKYHGKLHYHCLFETNKIRKLQDFCKTFFASNPSKNNTAVIIKLITPRLKPGNHSDELICASLMESKHYIFTKYFRKEQHNRLKCLVHWTK